MMMHPSTKQGRCSSLNAVFLRYLYSRMPLPSDDGDDMTRRDDDHPRPEMVGQQPSRFLCAADDHRPATWDTSRAMRPYPTTAQNTVAP